MSARLVASVVVLICGLAAASSGEKRLNHLVSELLEVSSISGPSQPFAFTRSSEGWIFVSSSCSGKGTVRVILDQERGGDTLIVQDAEVAPHGEAMRYVTKGRHAIQVEARSAIKVQKVAVRAIPELIRQTFNFLEIQPYRE